MYISLLCFIGLLLLVLSLVWLFKRPAYNNKAWGYKSPGSLETEKNWNIANRFAARLMTAFAIGFLIIGTLLSLNKIDPQTDVILSLLGCLAMGGAIIFFTEQRLRKK